MSPWIDTIRNITAQEGCRALPGAFSDLILTSPPFDETFRYAGHWYPSLGRELAPELYRIAKPGSVLCWMTRDQIVDGKQTAESHLQVLAMITAGWWKQQEITFESGYLMGPPGYYFRTNTSVYIFTKGWRSSRSNNLIQDVPVADKNHGRGMGYRHADARYIKSKPLNTEDYRIRGSTWYYAAGGNKTCEEDYLADFPAKMHEGLARDLIRSFSRPGDMVFDPFGGVMTTAKMAILAGRRYCCFEPDPKAFSLGARRIRETHARMST
jgi:DNA modification methylase